MAIVRFDVQVKSRFYDESGSKALREDSRFIADIWQATFRPREDFFLIFVAFNAAEVEMGPLWLVPSSARRAGVKTS